MFDMNYYSRIISQIFTINHDSFSFSKTNMIIIVIVIRIKIKIPAVCCDCTDLGYTVQTPNGLYIRHWRRCNL